MEAKEVIEKIQAEAKSEADAILKEAAQQAADYNKQTQEQLAEFDKQTEHLAQAAADDKKQRILAAARMKRGKDKLSAKQKVLTKIFEAAKENMLSMDKSAYRDMFKRLICTAVESGEETVIAGQKEKIIDASVIDQINQDEKSKAEKLKFADEKGEFDYGVCLIKGDVRTNITVDVLLQTARENLETKIAASVFAE
jgi:V/A-type H+/Na+-transporting ATPase subunit E